MAGGNSKKSTKPVKKNYEVKRNAKPATKSTAKRTATPKKPMAKKAATKKAVASKPQAKRMGKTKRA